MIQVGAVVHADPVRDLRGRVHHYGPDKPDAYHVSEKDGEKAAERWRVRYPQRRTRVARLVEV